jgi:hypothetical protein
MTLLCRVLAIMLIALLSVSGQQLSFVKAPTFTGSGSSWTVSFEVNQTTDVEVSIVNTADSSVVRHLAAGVLGPNAPSPFAKNSLSQSLSWNGKDDLGNTVSNTGSLSARVRAGMSVSLNQTVGENPYIFGSSQRCALMGMAQDETGALYIYGIHGSLAATTMRKFDQNGHYIQTIFPYPAGLEASRVSAYGVNLWGDGKYSPKCSYLAYPNISTSPITDPRSSMCTRVRNGKIWVYSRKTLELLKIQTDSRTVISEPSVPLITQPALPYWRQMGGPIHVYITDDNQYAYVSGFYECNTSELPVDTGFYKDGQIFKVDLNTGIATSWLSIGQVPVDELGRRATIGPRVHRMKIRPECKFTRLYSGGQSGSGNGGQYHGCGLCGIKDTYRIAHGQCLYFKVLWLGRAKPARLCCSRICNRYRA